MRTSNLPATITCSALTAIQSALPAVPYAALILVEPALITRAAFAAHLPEREGALVMMRAAVSKRRDSWASRDDARAYFESRFPWQMWDPRVFELFVVSS